MNSDRIRGAAPALALVALLLAAPGWATEEAENPTVAIVDGAEIHESEVLEVARSLPAEYQAQLEQIFPALVQRLVDFRLLANAADAAGLAADPEVKRRLDKLEQDVMREVYLEREIDQQVNDTSLRARYDAFVAANPPEAEVRARHILLEDEAAAKEVITELDGGADFANLAREKSKGPSSTQGGDLGYFTRGQMVPEFAEAAFAMDSGAHSSAPVKTQFGWHVIKVEDRRDSEPPAFGDMQEQLREEMSREAVNAVIATLRSEATIEIVPRGPVEAPTELSQ